jgi:hypothetical protein
MRKHVVVLLALVGSARADTAKAIDLAPVAEKLAAYKDEVGNLYVVPQLGKFDTTDEAQKWIFYGDGKTLYQQKVIRFATGKNGFELSLVAPRAKDMQSGGWLVLNDDGKYIACRPARVQGGKRELTALSADETKTLLSKAKFLPPMANRVAHFLGRDDDANYYYVDRLPPESGGKGYRVYVGQTGAMKLQALTNMASDSMGEIYATKTGKLKITAGKDPQAFWVKGGKKIELTVVPPLDNRYLVYRELGIYGALGNVCDDQ